MDSFFDSYHVSGVLALYVPNMVLLGVAVRPHAPMWRDAYDKSPVPLG